MNYIKKKLQGINLQNYNQKLLAIIGTCLVVVVAGSLLIGITAGLFELIGSINFGNKQQDVVLINTGTETDSSHTQKPIIRKHEISFENPQLIDSASAYYLIPIGHVRLENEEVLNSGNVQLAESNELLSSNSNYKRKVSYNSYGFYNNITVFNGKTNVSDVLFKDKTIITQYNSFVYNGRLTVLMIGSQQDSDKDKSLTSQDFSSLFIYDVFSKTMKTIAIAGESISSYSFIQDQNKLFLNTVKDKNNNGQIEQNEPKLVYLYDLDSYKISSVLQKSDQEIMQGMLDR